MRELRVIGLDVDGKYVVCEDAERSQTFRLPADEHLRAAARGDLTRLGQIEIEIEAQLRPKEIQARIRAGATVAQVAAAAGLSEQKVERYAFPVLLERSKAAEIAQGGHPVLADGPAVGTLLHAVTVALDARGQGLTGAEWDAWRGDDGRWVVQLRWRTGRSENRAHWRFVPGAHGGTVTALDDAAAELLDPTAARPLRPVTTVLEVGTQPVLDVAPLPVAPAPAPDASRDESADQDEDQVTDGARASDGAGEPGVADRASTKGHRGRPSMPSWEDVLLGVRSQRG